MDWFISGNVEHFPGMMVYNSVADLLYSGSTEAVFSLSPVAQASKQASKPASKQASLYFYK